MATSQEVREEVASLSTTQTEFLRAAASNDLYVLSKGILGYSEVNPRTHGGLCNFIQREEKLRRLLLMPRTTLKTTIATIADSIRLAVANVDEARILIANEVAENAQKFLTEIKGHWEKDNLLTQLFPDLKPKKLAGPGARWNQAAASLDRKSSYKEDTWTTVGVGGTQVGSHFTRIKCDDLIGFEAAESPAAMDKAIKWVDNIESLLTNIHTDIIDFIGTRWARNDVYRHVINDYGDRLAKFVRQAIENGEVIFPEKHSLAVFAEMMAKRPQVYYAQYANNPLADATTDFPKAIKEFWFSLDGERVLFKDELGKTKGWRVEELDVVMTCDPNGGSPIAPDEAAITVTGVSPKDQVFLLSEFAGRPSPSGFVDEIYKQAKRWHPRVLGIEEAGQQSTKHYFDKKALQEGFYIRTETLRPRNRNKIERIRKAVEPLIRSGRVYALVTQTKFRTQADQFPNPEDDLIDVMDSFAYGPEIWRKPNTIEELEEDNKILKLVVSKRNKRTGY